jgi:hypothetical protein
MKSWRVVVMALACGAVLALAGCSKKQEAAPPKTVALSDITGSTAGVKWGVPTRWSTQGERPMRVVTYTIPVAEGDPEAAECAVFYFGGGQGGDVDANLNRWASQFETSGAMARAEKQVGGMKVTTVGIVGAYLAPSGPMMQSSGKKENYRLLGAIVEGPQGSIFFKLTGPAKTVTAAEGEFSALVESLAKM